MHVTSFVTCITWYYCAITCITCNYMPFLSPPSLCKPSMSTYNDVFAANTLNTHEDLRSRPGTWMVAGFLPHIDPAKAKYPDRGGNSIAVRNVELMAQCNECLFERWNETYAEPLPMEYADGKTRLTHAVAASQHKVLPLV